ncbi:hypothetical protein CERSUDRAFT_117097 [Gelatoporia subvermispora B]|uniref:F-box domain-containing protein n=1 Tax=Ceriporiopsis subvermispora (strain B) TaxID=914234 RepID=M2R724_CERS8|nr:hypothetical protein CERSUDRAFT_117097 [Gelatoporia subvermispora B]
MATTFASRSASTPQPDEIEPYARDGNEEYKSHKASGRYTRVHSPSLIGGLPLELWWNVLEITDDPRALLATGYTCKAFCGVVRNIIEKRTIMMELNDLLDDPTRGYFFRGASIRSAILSTWISTYDPKSLRLQAMLISDGRLLLRSQTRSAFSRLKSVTDLTLHCIHFSTFSDFSRTVCALPNLSTLVLRNVTVNDSRSYSLQGIYFARSLRLKWLDEALNVVGRQGPSRLHPGEASSTLNIE